MCSVQLSCSFWSRDGANLGTALQRACKLNEITAGARRCTLCRRQEAALCKCPGSERARMLTVDKHFNLNILALARPLFAF